MTDGSELRVIVCDDHALYRRGLVIVLDDTDDIEVVAEASNGTEAIELARELAPDVVLMDVRMPGLSGIDTTRQLVEVVPTTKILVLTVSDEGNDLFEAVKAGASGYLLKEISITEIADAIRAVVAGNSLLTPSMATKLMSEFAALSRRADNSDRGLGPPRLTSRELEVLRHVAQGRTNRDIASELEISENTVKNHVRNILEKLQLHTRTEAVMYAVKERLLET